MEMGSKPCQDQFLHPTLVHCRKNKKNTNTSTNVAHPKKYFFNKMLLNWTCSFLVHKLHCRLVLHWRRLKMNSKRIELEMLWNRIIRTKDSRHIRLDSPEPEPYKYIWRLDRCNWRISIDTWQGKCFCFKNWLFGGTGNCEYQFWDKFSNCVKISLEHKQTRENKYYLISIFEILLNILIC